ncbi:hypothetical protein ACI48D_10580 [Massilia sp. LXY-6]|uniref:hypothetical protein n=1 Tax=Massilia sp. LXY-6 TaxID=3379823 RepID=UPI003EDF1B9E
MTMYGLRKIANIRRLVAALEDGPMGPVAIAELLGISHTGARNYIDLLVEGGAAIPHPDRRTHVCLHPDWGLVEDFLDSLAPELAEQRVTLRRSPSRHCVDPGKSYLHVVADDVRFPLVLMRFPVRRDPLVAALFGAGGR